MSLEASSNQCSILHCPGISKSFLSASSSLNEPNGVPHFYQRYRQIHEYATFLRFPLSGVYFTADNTQIGSLFTLFLHAPVKAFAFISDLTEMSKDAWERCIAQLSAIENTLNDLFDKESALGEFPNVPSRHHSTSDRWTLLRLQ